MRISLTGRLRARNRLLLGILILYAICPRAAEAKKKRRHQLLKTVQIHTIYIETTNIFDPTVPGENFWLFRVANFLHIETKDSVIRRELLVRQGENATEEQIEEAERDLRALPFIKEATINQHQTPDGGVDLHVKTQDSWTTQPQVNFASEGGQTSFSTGFEELNLLGYGKDLSYFYKKNIDGVSNNVSYSDPQFANTRVHLQADFQKTPSGDGEDLNLTRPFYSYETRTAAGVPFSRSTGLQKVYQGGELISQYDQENLNVSPFIGLWVNNDPLNVLRVQTSYRYTESISQPDALTLPGTLPDNKALSGPILNVNFVQSDFIKETFADKTGRVEDFNLGHQAGIGIGYVGRNLGATENSLPLAFNDSFGFGGNGPWFSLVSYGMSSRYTLYADNQAGGKMLNSIYFANFNYYRHLTEDFPMTGVVHAESAYLQNPDNSNVLSLGGDSGLRAYKINSYTGNKSVLLNIEDRFYYPNEVLHLAYVGGAIFFDGGQVQPEGLGFDKRDFHTDVGIGMRFGLSRSADGTVFRVDLAYALGPVQQSNRIIVSISAAQGFTQIANTYKNFAFAGTVQ